MYAWLFSAYLESEFLQFGERVSTKDIFSSFLSLFLLFRLGVRI